MIAPMIAEPAAAMNEITIVGIRWIELARDDVARRAGERAGDAEQRPGVEVAGGRLDDQQRADEPDADRGPAPPADFLARKRSPRAR